MYNCEVVCSITDFKTFLLGFYNEIAYRVVGWHQTEECCSFDG